MQEVYTFTGSPLEVCVQLITSQVSNLRISGAFLVYDNGSGIVMMRKYIHAPICVHVRP